MIILDGDGKPGAEGLTEFDTLNRDFDELIRCMRVRDVREVVFREFAVAKELYEKEIEALDFTGEEKRGKGGSVISLNESDERLKEYVDFMVRNPEFREMMLEEFYSILKPLYGKKM